MYLVDSLINFVNYSFIMKNGKKFIFKVICAALVVLLVIVISGDFIISNYLCNYALSRSGDGGNRTVSAEVPKPTTDADVKIEINKNIQYAKNDAWLEAVPANETFIQSDDGLKLKGFYWLQENDSDKWVIAIHGYRSNHWEMISAGQNFYERGFNVLTPDLRACGESEGKYVGMGWLDRKDILKWIDWVIAKNPSCKIIIMGESMGGATTMMTSGENTPDNVVAFVEDCGYSSVWDIFEGELKLRFHLPTFPILNTASLISKIKAGYSFKEASAVKQLQKCSKPVLFLHGDADDFVTFPNLERVYNAKVSGPKDQLIINDAGHCKAAYVERDEYYKKVFDFINQYM